MGITATVLFCNLLCHVVRICQGEYPAGRGVSRLTKTPANSVQRAVSDSAGLLLGCAAVLLRNAIRWLTHAPYCLASAAV